MINLLDQYKQLENIASDMKQRLKLKDQIENCSLNIFF